MKNDSRLIEVMPQIKEEFTEIFENSKNLGEGTIKLGSWLIKAKSFFPKTVRTIKNGSSKLLVILNKEKLNCYRKD